MKYAYIPKEYSYDNRFMGINEAIVNYESQEINLKKINVNLLVRYREIFRTNTKYLELAEAEIVVNDINKLIFEINQANKSINKVIFRLSKGVHGEDKVNNIISSLKGEYACLRGISINIEGSKIENDFLLIGNTGVSTFEVKNVGNKFESLIIDEYGRVERVDKKGNTTEICDMIEQSNRHFILLERFLRAKLKESIPNIPVHDYIVITSDIRIRNESNFNIIGPNQIIKVLKNNPICLSEEEVIKIKDTIINNSEELNKYPYYIYDEVLLNNYKLILKSIHQLIK
nr:nuclease-related domain-containing protein [Clostridium paraputrificum]